ncbi:hypothetical protein JCM17380_05870 [Desulfosporosinus burensis]
MDGQPRAKPDKQAVGIQPTGVPVRLYVGVILLFIGVILYLFSN